MNVSLLQKRLLKLVNRMWLYGLLSYADPSGDESVNLVFMGASMASPITLVSTFLILGVAQYQLLHAPYVIEYQGVLKKQNVSPSQCNKRERKVDRTLGLSNVGPIISLKSNVGSLLSTNGITRFLRYSLIYIVGRLKMSRP